MTSQPEIPPVGTTRALGVVAGFLLRRPVLPALSVGLLLALIALELALPQFLGDAITGLGSADPRAFPLGRAVAGFLGLVALRSLIGRLLGPLRNLAAQRALGDIRAAVYDALQRRPFAWHDNARTGELISRAGTDVARLQDFLHVCLLFAVDVAAGVAGTLALLFAIDAGIGRLALGAMLPTAAAMAFFAARLQPRWRRVHDRHGAMTAVIQENIAGVRVVKAFAREAAEVAKFRGRRDAFLRELLDTVNYWAARVPFAQFLFGLGVPLVLWAGGRRVIEGALPIGDLAKAVFYLLGLGGRIGVIGQVTNILQNSGSAARRVHEILADPAPPVPDGDDRGPITGAVRFEQVRFVHAAGPSLREESDAPPPRERPSPREARPALDGVSFDVPAGTTVAVVGPTGSGKSTLLSLVPRFHEASSGRVCVDGRDVRSMGRDGLRRSVGVVFQETFLFSATVADNIAFGRPDAPRAEVEAAARAACADGFIRELAQGYDTVVGERGVSLSGGQRQRVAIARALLMDPAILLLDDATSAVDPGTEREILAALTASRRGRTTFLVAQRLAAVRAADLVLVMSEGRIVDRGVHAELLGREGVYREMFRGQTA